MTKVQGELRFLYPWSVCSKPSWTYALCGHVRRPYQDGWKTEIWAALSNAEPGTLYEGGSGDKGQVGDAKVPFTLSAAMEEDVLLNSLGYQVSVGISSN